jgi:glycosyltransferase involved in cell wall biosynthesis
MGAYMFSRIHRIPITYYFHGTETNVLLPWWKKGYKEYVMFMSERLASIAADSVVVPCVSGKQYLMKRSIVLGSGKKISILPNIVSDEYQVNMRQPQIQLIQKTYPMFLKTRIILYRGSITPVKGLISLIRAFALFKNVTSKYTILVILYPKETEDHMYSRMLKDIVDVEGLSSSVYLIPDLPMEEQIALLKTAWVSILPSYFEFQPLVLLESLAAQVPMFVSPVGDCIRIISHIDQRYLLKSNDSAYIVNALFDHSKRSDGEIQLFREKALNYMIRYHSEKKISTQFLSIFYQNKAC